MRTPNRVRLLVLLMLLALLPGVTVRAEEHTHTFVEERTEPTCETSGAVWLACIYCPYTTGYTPIPSPGHSFGEWQTLLEPTCTQDGVQVRECSVCGKQETEDLPAPGHAYAEKINEPTCTARGSRGYLCSRCDDWVFVSYIPPLGHEYDDGVLLREPTETTLGHVRFCCIRCKETYHMTYAFRDIDSDAYYFTPVIWAVNNGITSGIDETHFDPGGLCNRAQVVTFLWRAAGKPIPTNAENPFVDVPSGCFYEQAVLWAYETSITTGTDATHFSPSMSCNRAQVVTFLHRYHGCPEPTEAASFPDVAEGSFYHRAVQWAAGRGITRGMDGGLFRPEVECSRAQIVTFLYRDEKNP